MTEFSASITHEAAPQAEFNLQSRLDALQCGECSEDDFLQEILTRDDAARNLLSTTLAQIEERHRCGQWPEESFRILKSRIAGYQSEDHDYTTTIEINPATRALDSVTERTAQFDVAARAPAVSADSINALAPLLATLQTIDVQTPGQSTVRAARSESRSSADSRDVGRVLCDRYALQRVIGRGGMGTVFKALDRYRVDLPEADRHVALKVLDKNVSQRPEILADLRREFYCAQALSHPNIVRVYEQHHDGDVAFFTMELLEGQPLSAMLQSMSPQPLERSYAWAIIRDVGAGVAHAHSRNVVHGDLKPHNIMITDRGEVRVLDFGASGSATRQWSTSETLRRNRLPAVTLAYACCELLDGQQTDPRDDLYALACLSYELLAGEHPFQQLRSTEARALGIRPRRPPGLTQRQWRSLQLGLSWHRDGRSIAVRDWLGMMGLDPAAERLPAPGVLGAPYSSSRKARVVLQAALLVPLVFGLFLWVAFSYTKIDRNVAGKPAGLQSQRSTPSDAQTISTEHLAVPAATQEAPAASAIKSSVVPPQPAPVSVQQEPPTEAGRHIAAALETRPLGPSHITLAADTYRLSSAERFAEISVRRSSGARDSGSFVWWTEASSAKPGSDFVPQERTAQLFLSGRRSARLFIRLVPNFSRTHTQIFYVAIGEPSRGYALGPVTRAAILLPPLSTSRDTAPVDFVAQRR